MVGLKFLQASRELAEKHYAVHKDRSFYESLLSFLTAGPTVAVVFEGREAVAVARNLIGKTDGVEALPGSIRGDFAISKQNNLVHGSDSPENAATEIRSGSSRKSWSVTNLSIPPGSRELAKTDLKSRLVPPARLACGLGVGRRFATGPQDRPTQRKSAGQSQHRRGEVGLIVADPAALLLIPPDVSLAIRPRSALGIGTGAVVHDAAIVRPGEAPFRLHRISGDAPIARPIAARLGKDAAVNPAAACRRAVVLQLGETAE